MAYQKITVTDGEIITDDWGNHIQTQYENAMADFKKVSLTVATGQATTGQKAVEIATGGAKDLTFLPADQTAPGFAIASYFADSCRGVKISDTQILLVSGSNAATKYMYATLYTLKEDTVYGKYWEVTASANTTALSYAPSKISITPLTATTYLVAWSDLMDASMYTAVVTITSTTVSWGTVNGSYGAYLAPQLMPLTSTTAMVMFRYSTSALGAAILTVSGGTVTMGTITQKTGVNFDGYYRNDFVKTDTNRGIYTISNSAGNRVGYGISISGTTITWGTDGVTIFNEFTNGQRLVSSVLLGTNKVLYTCGGSAAAGPMYAVIVTINSSNVITRYTPYNFSAMASSPYREYTLLIKVSDTRVDYLSGTYHYILTIDGNSITAVKTGPSIGTLAHVYLVSNAGSTATVAVPGETIYIKDINVDGYAGILGIATETKASGETVSVDIGPVIDGFTGLSVGEKYYALNGGALTTTPNNYLVGIALSSTQILKLSA